ncbi:spermatogenesis-associated serine-rich protein 1 isoform X1 [Xenopus laevis]|uniref:Spermatogenesis-associated serine-rich protein 1 isoform X1 n=1 Tax=Xenopus laevis TaxID=8355 RepID=A0A8J1KW70_XENLA|nr:spermatogenesis-associated serine-rich protein 1 isoform X1 [Xenopus laevis]
MTKLAQKVAEDNKAPYPPAGESASLQPAEFASTTMRKHGVTLPSINCPVPSYPNWDLDWKPSARWLPSPRYSDAPFPHIKDMKFPDRIRLMRPGPRHIHMGAEWSFYPNSGLPFTYHTGKRCSFEGTHLGNRTSLDVEKLEANIGTKKKVCDPRNGIPLSNPGDKPFISPEYSPSFHKFGSTRPLVNLRDSYRVRADTFIPLQKPPPKPRVPYREKEAKQNWEESKQEVKELNTWKPSQRSFTLELPVNGQQKNGE